MERELQNGITGFGASHLNANMSLPSGLGAAVNAIEVLGRYAARTGSIEADLLTPMHVGMTIVSEYNVLAVTFYGDQTSGSLSYPIIEDLRCQNPGPGLIEGGHEVEALVSLVVRARKPAEVDLSRSDVTKLSN